MTSQAGSTFPTRASSPPGSARSSSARSGRWLVLTLPPMLAPAAGLPWPAGTEGRQAGDRTEGGTHDRAVPARRVLRGLAAGGCARRADRVAEIAAAEVVLRRAGQRAIRQDHAPRRVLPDQGRTGDPARRGRPDSG